MKTMGMIGVERKASHEWSRGKGGGTAALV